MECKFQIFNARWTNAATLTVKDPQAGGERGRSIFEYDLDYTFEKPGERQPLSLRFPVSADIHELDHWPPFLYDLIPQGGGREHLLGELNLPDDRTSDFALVLAGAFNPIGNLRVSEAVAYFSEHKGRFGREEHLEGVPMEAIIGSAPDFVEQMFAHSMLASGSTGVQGAAPKYLMTEDRAGLWHADSVLADEEAAAHFIVKRPRGKKTEADRKVLRNEAAYTRTAAALGLRVHGELKHINDVLFIPRFDRRVIGNQVQRFSQESAASIAGLVGFNARTSQFELIESIREVVTDREAETFEFLRRDVLNLAMRNTDNHARNTAVQCVDGVIRLTPLFDFAPMYLDPEGIARAIRWTHPETGKELRVWGDVLDAMDIGPEERGRLGMRLAAFGEKLESLQDLMRSAGVDDDIIVFLQPSIDEQVRQLKDLAHRRHG